MPIYDYLCTDCGAHYDVFHKSAEVVEDIVCPSCQSPRHRKLISLVAVAGKNISSGPGHTCAAEERGGSCCGGGMCGTN